MRFFLGIVAVLCAPLLTMAQNSKEESLGLPGDNLNLYAALKLFQECQTLEEFEKKLNSEDDKINNLDLDEDGNIDYIKVADSVDKDVHNSRPETMQEGSANFKTKFPTATVGSNSLPDVKVPEFKPDLVKPATKPGVRPSPGGELIPGTKPTTGTKPLPGTRPSPETKPTTRPTPKPVTKPSTKPTPKPVTKPSPKPTPQPVPKPAPKPVPKTTRG